jgi:predicted glycoside hydrolase/deacetylase ChbG (UPF0249 family)
VSGPRASRLLIVNADDYGLTPAVSEGILRAHRDGVVTSTSVLSLARGFSRTARWLADEAHLGVGIHLAAIGEDAPILTAREIPTIVDRRGRLAASWRAFLRWEFQRRVDPADVAREFAAQAALVSDLGVTLTHLDTHQHLHLWPSVGRVVIELAAALGVGGLRIPRSRRTGPTAAIINSLARRLVVAADEAKLATPVASAGLDEAGHLDDSTLGGVLDGFAASGATTAELGTHPGADPDPERHRYRWGYSWAGELNLMTAPATRAEIERRGFVLGTYADLKAWSPQPR